MQPRLIGHWRDVPLLLISAVIVVVIVITMISNTLFSGMTQSVEDDQFATVQTIVTSALRSAEDRALARAQMIADLPSTKTVFAGRDAAARARLLADLRPLFDVQHDKFGVDQMAFHVPPATSFLRLQAPASFGDDLSEFRPLVVAVNRDQIARKGTAVARTGPAIFGVVPVFDANRQHLGSFEVGIDFATVLDGLKADYGLELALLISEDPIRRFVTPELSASLLNDANRVGKYLKTTATHWDLLKEVVTPSDVATVNGIKRFTASANGTAYGVILVPIRNFAGDTMGMVAVAKDFSASRAAVGQTLVLQLLVALLAIVALSGVVLIVVRGMLLEPIKELKELAGPRE